MRYLVWLTVLLIILGAVPTMAEDGDGGWAGAFYYVPIGARPAAMGGAYLAVSDDGAGPLYNPAGLANITNIRFATAYRLMKLDRQLGYATFVVPTRGNSALGVHYLYAGDKGLKARDTNGRELGWEINKNDHDFSVFFAKRFEKLFAVGIKANYLHATFAEMSAFTVSFDFGAMLYLSELVDREKRDLVPIQDIQVGLTVRRIGAKYRWTNEDYLAKYTTSALSSEQDDTIPWEIGLGGAALFFDRKLLVAADILKNIKQSPFLHAGAEYRLYPEFAVRGGYSDGRLTAGTGYLFRLAGKTITIDYAFSTDKADEGSEHIFSFDLLY
ncbi:MAG: PorV/PorQ family protein [candidate division Zixibacteria bacterium]|nr:PorV/PorQ family protein [candidate division Zixibacteria bacterium]